MIKLKNTSGLQFFIQIKIWCNAVTLCNMAGVPILIQGNGFYG